MKLKTVLSVAALSLFVSGCGSPAGYMREVQEEAVLEAPPPGKVLVNIHRPSDYGGGRVYSIFDRTTFVGASRGEQRIQYVCDPGEHVFIGYLESSMWATVRVIKANLKADKIYDCVIDSSYFTSGIGVVPLKKGEKRRKEIPEWEEDDEDTVAILPGSGYKEHEAELKEKNEQILKDFLEGDKKEKVQTLAPDDHR